MRYHIIAYMAATQHVTFTLTANSRDHALRLARWDPRARGAVRFSAVRI